MVCLGNICRSPIAEYVLKKKVQEQNLGWIVDSCGTNGYHIGDTADSRGISVCREMGLDITAHRAKRFKNQFFDEFDIIYALATDVYDDIRDFADNDAQMKNVKLILDEMYPGKKKSVKDPWYGNRSDFVDVYKQLDALCDVIIDNYKNRSLPN